MSAALTRRAALSGAVASVAMVGAAAAVAMPIKVQARSIIPRLLRIMALHDRADAQGAWFYTNVFEPRRNAYLAAVAEAKAVIMRPVPHAEVATTFVNINDDVVRLSTSMIGTDATARRVVSDPTWADIGDETWRQAHREIAVLHDRRRAAFAKQEKRFAAAEKRAMADHGVEALRVRCNTLSDRQWALWRAAMTLPSLTMADVVAKLDFLDRTGSEASDYTMELLAADLRHLARVEG